MKTINIITVCLLLSIAVTAQTSPHGISVNDIAPDFIAKDQNGNNVQLKNELRNGAVVVVFYRGQWCPYCNKQLNAIQDSLGFIEEKGATLITVSPETSNAY